jgi:transcriptional antiterminator
MLQVVLWQHPKGIEIAKIAEICSVSERTVYRDLKALSKYY